MNQEPNGGAAGAVEHITAQPIERRADWTGQAGAASAVSLTPERRAAVREAVATALGDAYDCTRHWSAWHVGTMTSDDFTLVADQDARLDEIVDALLGGLPAPSAKQEPAAAYMHADGRVVPAATMDAARSDGGAMASSLRDYTIELVPRTAAPSASASPAAPEMRPSAWQHINTLPYSDDLVWLRHGDSIEGPRPMGTDDYDRFSEWAPCEPPSFSAAPVAGSQQVPELSDEGIVKVLASLGIDATKSKYGFPELQVSTNVPGIRKVVEIYLAAAPAVPVPAEQGNPPTRD